MFLQLANRRAPTGQYGLQLRHSLSHYSVPISYCRRPNCVLLQFGNGTLVRSEGIKGCSKSVYAKAQRTYRWVLLPTNSVGDVPNDGTKIAEPYSIPRLLQGPSLARPAMSLRQLGTPFHPCWRQRTHGGNVSWNLQRTMLVHAQVAVTRTGRCNVPSSPFRKNPVTLLLRRPVPRPKRNVPPRWIDVYD